MVEFEEMMYDRSMEYCLRVNCHFSQVLMFHIMALDGAKLHANACFMLSIEKMT